MKRTPPGANGLGDRGEDKRPADVAQTGDVRPRPSSWRASLALFLGVALLALAVRVLCLLDLGDSPTFLHPIVDADTYDALARSFVKDKQLTEGFFWQPFFYPMFLSLYYLLLDRMRVAAASWMLWAKAFQIGLGAISCGLAALLARRLFDWRTALLAGVVLAFCAPVFFLETELIATAFEVFWGVVLVWLFVRLGKDASMLAYPALGLCGGLSVVTRPTFLPFFVAGCAWQAIVLRRACVSWKRILVAGVLILAGFLAMVEPVAFLNRRTNARLLREAGVKDAGKHLKKWTFLPDSRGINLYIGNNLDSDRTLAIRPGWAWDRLTLLPWTEGVPPSQASSYFSRRVREYVLRYPLDFAAGIAKKTVQFVSSREIPRNVEIYRYREWSPLLGALVWKWGGFGFPFGVILPLAVVGLAAWRRSLPVPVWLFLAFYPLAVIAVFVSSRYRAPVMPVLSIAAAAGAMHLFDLARRRQYRRLGAWAGGIAAIALVVSLPGPFSQEKNDYAAEMYYCLGSRFLERRQEAEAMRAFNLALHRRPDYPEVLDKLGLHAHRRGNMQGAESFFRDALKANDRHEGVHLHLGDLLEERGKTSEAEKMFRRALELDPLLAEAHDKFGILLARTGRRQEALAHFQTAARLRPNDAGYATNLGAALFEMGRVEESIAQYRRALTLDPKLKAARQNLEEALKAARARETQSRKQNR